jgi:hypothetical protein
VPIDSLWEGEESVIADIRDLSAMAEAASGMDAMVPLAGHRDGTIPRSKFSADEFCAAQNRLFTIECQPLALTDKP